MKRFVGAVLTVLTLALGAVAIAPTAALAHDEVVSTLPADNAEVAPGDLKIAVTFNEDILNIPPHQGLAIQITDPSGKVNLLPCVDINGVELSGNYSATETGSYQVDWRSVSNDGHANSGSFNFTVADGATAGQGPDANSVCAAEAKAAAAKAKADAEAEAAAAEAAGPAPGSTAKKGFDPIVGLGMGIGLFVVLSLLGAFAAEMQKRSRARKAELKKLKAEVEANPDMLRDL